MMCMIGKNQTNAYCFFSILQMYDKVAMLYADICGFHGIVDKASPSDVAIMLNTMYKKFDAIVDANKLYRVRSMNCQPPSWMDGRPDGWTGGHMFR